MQLFFKNLVSRHDINFSSSGSLYTMKQESGDLGSHPTLGTVPEGSHFTPMEHRLMSSAVLQTWTM